MLPINPIFFPIMNGLFQVNLREFAYLKELFPYYKPTGICQGPEILKTTELPGALPITKQYPPRNGRLIT